MKLSETGQPDNDKVLAKIEKKINKEYTIANKEMEKKLQNYMKKFEAKDKEKKKLVKSGQLSQDDYIKWRQDKIVVGKQWESMCQVLAEDLDNSRIIAQHIVSNDLPTVYANGVNYGTYEIEKTGINTNFTLYNHDAVEILVSENPKLYPDPTMGSETWQKLKSKEVQKWSKAKINSAVTQAILQGEAIDQIAKRLRKVTDMDYKASIRNARTMVGAAQNAGHQRSYERAENMGVNLVKVWVSTIDMRTRHTHAVMDGEAVPVKEKFSNGLLYPRDILNGTPAEVYNCRCRPISQVKGFEKTPGSLIEGKQDKLNGMTYDEWKQYHQDVLDGKFKKPAKEAVDTSSDVLQGFERTQDYLNDLYDIASANPVNEKAVRLIEENRKEVADLFGVTEEQAAKFLDDGIAKIIEDSEMAIAIDASKFEKVLSDGYFKNQFETNSSGGILSFDDRKRCEFKEFNVPTGSKILDADRPIYGALQPKYDPDDVDAIYTWQRMGGARYGNGIKVVLDKDKVINNSTVTIGDSLNRQFDIFGTEMANPKFTGAVWGEEDMIARVGAGEASAADAIKAMTEYYEFQLHGKDTHSIDIIERVMIDASQIFGKKSVIKMLDDKGIPWELYGRKNQIEDAMQWLNT